MSLAGHHTMSMSAHCASALGMPSSAPPEWNPSDASDAKSSADGELRPARRRRMRHALARGVSVRAMGKHQPVRSSPRSPAAGPPPAIRRTKSALR